MRPVIDDIFQELLTRHQPTGRVDLNDIAEVVGRRPVSYEDVEHLIDRLEAAGLRVAEPLESGDVEVLRAVLVSARRLTSELGRRPTVGEIALASGHAPHTVRRALEQAGRAMPC
ncbi:sigma-70 domain-containing protein [Sorangium sp. So ce1036]|uniref:sigma-70 domain-containing protein n=1 Tax=Sorangium sp. So ce1036 TaxID=3133328 RepID=UPI003F070EFE